MRKIRVLVVDDSAIVRRAVSDELALDPEIEIAGTASNGQIALARMTQVNPDFVLLDVEMPVLDGLKTLAELKKTHRSIPVMMFSSLTERGADATLDALMLGAAGYFTKPNSGGIEESRRIIREQLLPQIKAICAANLAKSAPARPADTLVSPLPRPTPSGVVDIVAIGVSTGGPNALLELFRNMPADLPVPIVIVQHMPPVFTKQLANRLTANSKIVVEEATSGAMLEPGRAWIAPGDSHMTVVRQGLRQIIVLDKEPQENSCRPSVDPLFRSVAKVFGGQTLAIIMTGMGSDGLRGCEAIKAMGGQVLIQDEASSVVWGMPGNVSRAGLADKVIPLALIGPEIVRRVLRTKD